MKTQCPRCRQMYEVEDKYEGQILTCSTCKDDFMVERLGSRITSPQHTMKPVESRLNENHSPHRFRDFIIAICWGAKSDIPGFKEPITVKILRVVSLFFVVVGTWDFISRFIVVWLKYGSEFGLSARYERLVEIFILYLVALACCACAQVVRFLAEIAHNTGIIAKK